MYFLWCSSGRSPGTTTAVKCISSGLQNFGSDLPFTLIYVSFALFVLFYVGLTRFIGDTSVKVLHTQLVYVIHNRPKMVFLRV